jgi:hypothetical protein
MYRCDPRGEDLGAAGPPPPCETPLTTHALKASDTMPLRMLRYLDLVVLAVALPIFVAAGLPLFAWAGVTAAWLLQRTVQALLLHRAESSGSPRSAIGLLSVSLIGRVWFLAFAVLVIGLIDRDSGLPAAVLMAVTFQVWFTAFFITRSQETPGAPGGKTRAT